MKIILFIRRITVLLVLVSISLFFSCKKFVEIKPPINSYTSSATFSNDQTATSAVIGLYQQMINTPLLFTHGGLSIFTALSSDEIKNTYSDLSYDAFANNSITANESNIQTYFWTAAYKIIYQANAIIEGVNASNQISAGVKEQLLGEAKFSRALCYFYLTNIFGDVPLQLTTDYRINATMSRTSSLKIYEQVSVDLLDAVDLLKPTYPTAGRVRPNKWTATAMLARVYLYQKKWAEAETASTAVINSGDYTLESELNNVFLSNSNEAIWQLQPLNEYFFSAEGSVFVPYNDMERPAFTLTNDLLSSFEVNDQRFVKWIGKNVIAGTDYYYPYKYKVKYPSGGPITEYTMVLRLAEQYLIRSEARAQQDNFASGLTDLNAIRSRAGLPGSAAIDKVSLLTAIGQERRVELFTEWGHRWLDLKVTSRVEAVLSSLKSPNWQPADTLYPIPFAELQLNPSLRQNPGY
ncbi:MAG: RagB/SusD family nutrient uptake outer membrane protein [Chitinophagaceae bacterium]